MLVLEHLHGITRTTRISIWTVIYALWLYISFDLLVSGIIQDVHWLIRTQLLLFCCLSSITTADLLDRISETEALSPSTVILGTSAIPELPLHVSMHVSHKHRRKHPGSYSSPAQSPGYKTSLERRGLIATSASPSPQGLPEIAPSQPESSTLPTGLAQPPLSPSILSKSLIRNYPVSNRIILL